MRLVDRYEKLAEKQIKEERLNKTRRYLALGFIIFRITVFCYNYFL